MIVEEVCAVLARSDAPTALFGHSMGALIAFEAARTLTAGGRPPIHLFISAAQTPPALDSWAHRTWTDEELAEEMLRFGGTPQEFLQDVDIYEAFIKILRCDYRLLDQYVYEPDPLLAMGITAFYGLADDYVTYEHVSGWRALTGAGFDTYPLAGGHFYDAASIPELCGAVESVLETLSGDSLIREPVGVLPLGGGTI
ncbi:thioesterase II family protein [Catenulispora yoronensis]